MMCCPKLSILASLFFLLFIFIEVVFINTLFPTKCIIFVVTSKLHILNTAFFIEFRRLSLISGIIDFGPKYLCVCCFVLLTRYWGNCGPSVISGEIAVPVSFLKTGDLGWPDPHPAP